MGTKIDGKEVNTGSSKKIIMPKKNLVDLQGRTIAEVREEVEASGGNVVGSIIREENGERKEYAKVLDKSKNTITDPVQLELNLSKAMEHREKVENYNKSLYSDRDPIVDKIELLGPKVMVRFFKLQQYSPEGLFIGGRTVTVPTESGTRKELVTLPDDFQLQERGVVVAISASCSESFKNTVKVGDIVDLTFASIGGSTQRWLHKETIGKQFDNYFLIPEHAIEMKVNL